jgi:uncharacterized protein (TIGR02611 family)
MLQRMGGPRALGRLRDHVVLGHLRPLLDDDEPVLTRLHVRSPDAGRRGVIAVTPARCLVHWGAREPAIVIAWGELRGWGVEDRARGGPVLWLESDEEAVAVQLPVFSGPHAEKASALIGHVAELAPRRVRRGGRSTQELGRRLPAERRTLGAHTRRVGVTVVGVLVVLVGVLFASPFVPGPGALTVLAGFAILAREYDWASDVHLWLERQVERAWAWRRRRKERRRAAGRDAGGSPDLVQQRTGRAGFGRG